MIQNPYIGKVFAGVEIGEEIGRGGMGVVMLGQRRSDDATVAVKLLPKTEAADDHFIARFEREAKLLMQLRHPNMLHVDNMGRAEDGTYFIVMEYIDGQSAGDLIKNLGKVPAPQAATIIRDVARALQAAHAQNVIHRDIKPDNILITRDGSVKLADFGLAKDTSENVKLTVTGQVLGTPAFMSPEQGKGLKVDHRTDIYSLGVTLYAMVAGRRPFQGSSPIEVVLKHIKEPPEPLEDVAPGLPEGLYDLVELLLAKEPENRIQTAEEMADALEEIAEEAGWDLTVPEAPAPADDLDMTLDIGGIGHIVKDAISVDQTQITEGENAAFTAQYVPTEEIVGDIEDSMVGRVIGEKYLVRSKLGEGGMGAVYLVRHTHLEQDFALKVLNPDLAANQNFRERFLREAKAATAFTHKHAIQIRDFGQEKDMLYMTMDFSRGETLWSVMNREGALSEMRVAVIAQQVLNALREAHAAGLIHRDLKPENIMMEKRHGKDFVRILDFGVAKLLDPEAEDPAQGSNLTRTGTVVGTLQYMSPEQASGDGDIDARSDLYSLAAILYEAVSGTRHIEAKNIQQMMYKLATSDPVPLPKRVKGLTKGFQALVMKNLDRDRERRSASADEFLAELEACSSHLHSTIAIRRSGHSVLVPALVAFIVVAAAVGILLVWNPFKGRAAGPASGPSAEPAAGPAAAPGKTQAELQAERDRAYEEHRERGDEAWGRRAWSEAVDHYQKARQIKETEEIVTRLKRAKWEIHWAAYETYNTDKDYRKALGEVTYGLLENHTTIEQKEKAETLETALNGILKKAEETFQTAKTHDEKGRFLQALPAYGAYIRDYPRGRHLAEAKARYSALLAEAKNFKGLVVESDPAGAEVVLDGITVGRTPCMVADVAPGKHTLIVDREGYLPVKKDVVYETGKRLAVRETLSREQYGSIRVLAKKGTLVVRWKGRSLGSTPATVEKAGAGSHVLEVVGPKDYAFTLTVKVEDGKTTRVEVDFDALLARERKAYQELPRGKTMAETEALHRKFLAAYPRGAYAAACRSVLADLKAENEDYKSCYRGADQDALLRACATYLNRYEGKTYPRGWFVEEVRAKLASLTTAREEEAWQAIGRKTTFAAIRLAAERYIEKFPGGAHIEEVRKIRDAIGLEEELFNLFSTEARFGSRLRYGRRYLKDYPKGLKTAQVRKGLEGMVKEEKGFYDLLGSIRDVEKLISKSRAYLMSFPGSDRADAVEKRMIKAEQEKQAFLETGRGAAQCEAYLTRYPRGWYRSQVEERLAGFGWGASSPGRPGFEGTMPPGVRRGMEKGQYVSRWDGAAMVYVPAGYFPLGTNDYYAEDGEKPEIMVYLHGFFIDRCEVTNRQYGRYLAWRKKAPNPDRFVHPAAPKGKDPTPAFWKNSACNKPDQPVVGVDWFDAWAYARWAGKLLPTEAQWEKAASVHVVKRSKTKYPWGDGEPTRSLCNFDGHEALPVKTLPKGASPAGALHMAGNVAEWCLDGWREDFLLDLARRYPPRHKRYVANPHTPKKGKLAAVRGGSFASDGDDVPVTRRRGLSGRHKTVGFRCVVWDVRK